MAGNNIPRTRTVTIHVHVSPTEHRAFRRLAGSRGLSRWIRERCLPDGILRPEDRAPTPPSFEDLLVEDAPVWNGNQFRHRGRWRGYDLSIIWRRLPDDTHVYDWRVRLPDATPIASGESPSMRLAKAAVAVAVRALPDLERP